MRMPSILVLLQASSASATDAGMSFRATRDDNDSTSSMDIGSMEHVARTA